MSWRPSGCTATTPQCRSWPGARPSPVGSGPTSRDDRPFAGPAPPAAMFHYSRDRTAEHPNRHLAGYAGILQADAYAGYNALYEPGRKPGPITDAGCWAHGRRKLFELAEVAHAPLAVEAVRRIDAIFDAERAINGLPAEQRLAVRREHIAPLVAELETWMQEDRRKLSRHSAVAKAMEYMLKRWDTFTRFLGDGRICLTNNAAERALRGIALAGSRGCSPAATVAATGLRPCTRSSSRPSSTTSTRAPGSPTCWLASPTIPPHACTNCCPGTGARPRKPQPPRQPDHGSAELRLHHRPRGRDARREGGLAARPGHEPRARGRLPLDTRHRRPLHPRPYRPGYRQPP